MCNKITIINKLQAVLRFNKARLDVERPFIGFPYGPALLIKSLLNLADPATGIVDDVSYHELAKLIEINPAPGRKESGTPSKQTIRNYIKSIEKERGEYFKVVSEGQSLKFLFPQLPKIFNEIFLNTEVDTLTNSVNTQENIDENRVFDIGINTDLNIEANTHSPSVKNINIFNITNSNKQTQTAGNDFSCSKKQISDDFYPNTKTIELALSMGLTKVTDFTEIQAFIKHNKKLNTQWADFNPVFITWLERDAQYMQKQQQKAQGQLRSNHNERGTNQSSLNPTALERVSQQHGISIESLWGTSGSELNSCAFIEGTLVQPMDETDSHLRTAFY
ncbi:TPA: Vir protein [Legionella pneumophila subsp. pneumophila]|uniref:Vir protein n=1 Tax=Legionella taurinensis TaxID=70611 RepID=A0A3A5L1Q2_9GAMM|nr:Vir protein [Legionella taurinensis]HAT9712877.1 Vir protein [Legionella pneumophila subsp. pneumophila]HAU9810089.1 Vir protein [Legionella pneumophila]RJT44465.1 Vir protein [Legionella taurinensis]HAU9905624.1 Vir protein [Legionella pneumophila]HAU9927070.1 Vir protein [Legionella pneumophila]